MNQNHQQDWVGELFVLDTATVKVKRVLKLLRLIRMQIEPFLYIYTIIYCKQCNSNRYIKGNLNLKNCCNCFFNFMWILVLLTDTMFKSLTESPTAEQCLSVIYAFFTRQTNKQNQQQSILAVWNMKFIEKYVRKQLFDPLVKYYFLMNLWTCKHSTNKFLQLSICLWGVPWQALLNAFHVLWRNIEKFRKCPYWCNK